MRIKPSRNFRDTMRYIYRVNREDYGIRNSDYSLNFYGALPSRRKRESLLSLIGEELLRKAPVVVAVMSFGLSDLNQLRSYLRRL